MLLDYNAITLIDAADVAAYPFTGTHINDVIKMQKAMGSNQKGVEEYLRKYCADDVVELTIQKNSLPYVKAQLEQQEYMLCHTRYDRQEN